MKIASADVAFTAGHMLRQQHTREETLVQGVSRSGAWNPEQLQDGQTLKRRQTQSTEFGEGSTLLDRELGGADLSELAARKQATAAVSAAPSLTAGILNDIGQVVTSALSALSLLTSTSGRSGDAAIAPMDLAVTPLQRTQIQLLVATMERLSGKAFRLLEPDALKERLEESAEAAPPSGPAGPYQPKTEDTEERTQGPAWGMVYTRHERYVESETTSFQGDAVVRTQDGREINVEVDLTMSRQFVSEQQIEMRAGAALQDPLVVNFEGTAAELSQTRFAFDLDVDGSEDQIRFVGPNSAFLALDRNGNGQVDDGGELFGPTTGNGFAELAAYDEDGNQWIDEQDSVYSRLRLWSRDQAGNQQLMGLGQRGVGAIYLGNVSTPFQVKDGDNELLGAVRSTGMYLNEDGTAGTMQQLDLVV